MRRIASKEEDEPENPLQSEIQSLFAEGKVQEGAGPIGPPVDASNEYSGGVYRRREPLGVDSPEYPSPDLSPGQGGRPSKPKRLKRTTTERTSPLPPPVGTLRPPEDDDFYDHILPTVTPEWYDPYDSEYYDYYDSTTRPGGSRGPYGPAGPESGIRQPAAEEYPMGRPGSSDGNPGIMRQPPLPDSNSPTLFDMGSKGNGFDDKTRMAGAPTNHQAESGT